MDRVAVLLATYNGEKYIGEMLRSLETQTFQDFVCYVHDDGSTDATRKIILDYVMRSPKQYVILDYPAQGSAKANFLSLLGRVDADYYFFADQDDVWLPTKLAESISAMYGLEDEEVFLSEQKRAKAGDVTPGVYSVNVPFCVYSDMTVCDAELNMISPSFHRYMGRDPHRLKYQQIMIDNPAAGCSMMINRPLRDLAIQYTDISEIEMHDSWVLMVAAVYGHIRYIDNPLICYRVHGDNEMGAKEVQSIEERINYNFHEFSSGRMKKAKKKFHERLYAASDQLLALPNLPVDAEENLKGFINLKKRGKIYRMLYYKRHGFTRERNDLWFRLWA